ncbi:hypothetical protein [Thermophagus xiamenensis]|uniref:Uncharacterized protein n=1 Tax=Thermophagus xiamenensis TaxID=385682 RepID=A0A1I1V691_9BACT|nr:hypothetical protein [Thermophagus xiamenensis]SFD78335.1 hypothetical protein SAMN05444380_10246 [Thermophagus xiamenensis]
MKTNKLYIVLTLLAYMVLAFSACQPDDYSLGEMISKDQLEFSITQNPDDPNMILLESLTPGVTPLWITPVGRSLKTVDTVKLAFPGTYKFVYGVQSAGGFVQADTVTVTLTTTNTNYISDPLWVLLTGGVGESKTWILDNGNYGLATGPLSYADPSREQVWGNYEPNWEPAGSDIGATETDYQAEMTFDLIDGAHLTAVKPNEENQNEQGVFSLNVEEHTLSTTDATIVRLAAFIPNATNWTNNIRILELTENQLRIAIMRTNEEGPWWYIFNYVWKEYAENYVPEAQPDPNFDHGDQMLILAGSSSHTWKISPQTPFNWADLNGGFLNNWYAMADYPDWTGFDESAIPNFENVRITFTRSGDVEIINNDGSSEIGTFDLEAETNLVTFHGVKPSFYISGGWVTITTTDYFEDEAGNVITGDNQWKIVKTKAISGITTDVWFGKRDTGKDEYMIFHFQLDADVPDFRREVTKALCGGFLGESERTFKIDLNWPVDWRNPLGEGWTEPGVLADWYWSEDIAASVEDQRITFKQVDGVITATKIDEEGNVQSSPVTIDPDNRLITMPDMDIIKFGAGSWLNTSGPDYYLMSFDLQNVEENGFWLGVKTGDIEYTSYHYILE